jgi:hypothetical protein
VNPSMGASGETSLFRTILKETPPGSASAPDRFRAFVRQYLTAMPPEG